MFRCLSIKTLKLGLVPYKDPSLTGMWVLRHMKKANVTIYIKSSQAQGCDLHEEICLNTCLNSLCGYLKLSCEESMFENQTSDSLVFSDLSYGALFPNLSKGIFY